MISDARRGRELLAGVPDGPQVRLARAVALAVLVEPALLRRARRELVPDAGTETESDLWFGPLVRTRNSHGMVLDPDAVAALREDLAGDLAFAERAFAVLAEVHRDHPALLRWEEQVAYRAVRDAGSAARTVAPLLHDAVKTVVTASADTPGLAGWAAQAWLRLPAEVRESEAGALLSVTSALRLGSATGPAGPGPHAFPSGIGALTPDGIRYGRIGVVLTSDALHFVQPEDGAVVEIPATEPPVAEVSWRDGDAVHTEVVEAAPGVRLPLTGFPADLVIRTLDGRRHRVRSPFAASSRNGRNVLVSYAPADQDWAEWIAWRIEEAGHSVVTQSRSGAPDDWTGLLFRVSDRAGATVAVLSEDLQHGNVPGQSALDGMVNVVGVLVRPGDRPMWVSRPDVVDLSGLAAAEAQHRLDEAVAEALARSRRSTPPPFPGATGAMPGEPQFPGAAVDVQSERLLAAYRDDVRAAAAAAGPGAELDVPGDRPVTVEAVRSRSGLSDTERALQHAAAASAALAGEPGDDLGRTNLGVSHLREAVRHAGSDDDLRVLSLIGLALALCRRFELTRDRADLDEAGRSLDKAHTATGRWSPQWSLLDEVRAHIDRHLGRPSDEAPRDAGDFAGLLGLRTLHDLPLDRLWAPRSSRGLLRVPIGVDDAGRPVLLDLKEPAHLGMGPHGLCVGATGSGKSELLRSLVLALLVTHPPEVLAMVLIDYKGGATFAPFGNAPHVAGLMTDLQGDAGQIARVHTGLTGEVQRRRQALKDAGNLVDIASYATARRRRPELPAMPYLLIVIDEYAELLAAWPEFLELFLSLGRIGRSIGVHLLLSSQRAERDLRGLESYLSYRLALRTLSDGESRTLLGNSDAYHLPPLPGFGYLKVDITIYQRFRACYVSASYREPDDEPETGQVEETTPHPLYSVGPVPAERVRLPSVVEVVTAQLAERAEPVPPVLLPPLPAAVTLDQIYGVPEVTAARGLQVPVRPGSMRVPIGLLDDPARRWQGEWTVDLTAAGGHLAVVGGSRSGRSTLLRTVVTSLALTHTPREVAVYVVDLNGGGRLDALAGLPHVGGIAVRADTERVRRTLEDVRATLGHRERVFRDHGIDGPGRMRELHAKGGLPELPTADVVLVIAGYENLRREFEEYEPLVAALLHRGGGHGVHVIASMRQFIDLRSAQQSTVGTQIELRLDDPADSVLDRGLARMIPSARPGRALTGERLFGQVALPRVDARTGNHDLTEAIAEIGRAARAAWSGPVAPPVRVLPARVDAADLLSEPGSTAVPIGVAETSIRPVLLDLAGRDAALLVFGDDGCGKTNLLALIARQLTARYSPDDLVFAVVDPRRGLQGVVPDEFLGGYAGTAQHTEQLIRAVAQQLEERRAGTAPGDRETWPRVVLLVDDYDILTAAGAYPLEPLHPFLPLGADLRLHVVLARRVLGASRGLYERSLMILREVGATGLVMSGERSEGRLIGDVFARALPPGRGQWVRRGEPAVLIQTALLPDR